MIAKSANHRGESETHAKVTANKNIRGQMLMTKTIYKRNENTAAFPPLSLFSTLTANLTMFETSATC